jgi:hypothetical protein
MRSLLLGLGSLASFACVQILAIERLPIVDQLASDAPTAPDTSMESGACFAGTLGCDAGGAEVGTHDDAALDAGGPDAGPRCGPFVPTDTVYDPVRPATAVCGGVSVGVTASPNCGVCGRTCSPCVNGYCAKLMEPSFAGALVRGVNWADNVWVASFAPDAVTLYDFSAGSQQMLGTVAYPSTVGAPQAQDVAFASNGTDSVVSRRGQTPWLIQRGASGLRSRALLEFGETFTFAVGTRKIFAATEDGRKITILDIGTETVEVRTSTNYRRAIAAFGDRAAWVEEGKLVLYQPNGSVNERLLDAQRGQIRSLAVDAEYTYIGYKQSATPASAAFFQRIAHQGGNVESLLSVRYGFDVAPDRLVLSGSSVYFSTKGSWGTALYRADRCAGQAELLQTAPEEWDDVFVAGDSIYVTHQGTGALFKFPR